MVDDIMKKNKIKKINIEEINQKEDETKHIKIETEPDSLNQTIENKEINNKEEKYIKKQKNKNSKSFSRGETIFFVIVSLLIGLSLGNLLTKTNVLPKKNGINDKYLNTFIENYEYIINNYYEELDKEELINNAISGMMDSLDDPYSMYMDEDDSSNFSITLDGSYQGIGIQIIKDEESGYMLVTSVFENSPASEAGLQSGDKIISVDNSKSEDMTASEFSSLVRNSDKEDFDLMIERDGKTLNIKLTKNTVTLNSVSSKIFDVENKKIGYIYIGVFANNTYTQFKRELSKLEKEQIDSLIIDVRSNTGGHLTAVDEILDIFLNSKQIMYQFEQNGEITSIYGNGKANKEYEIVLLGDSISASASEVLIAGLKDNLGSKFIGKKTYGKGTVQELVTLSDGTQYKITVKKWLTPKGQCVSDNEGINPDIDIELEEKYYQTYEDKDDTQLQAAIEYLKDR